jgi:hypothetical protein
MEVTGLIQRNIQRKNLMADFLNYEGKEIPMKMSLILQKFHTN